MSIRCDLRECMSHHNTVSLVHLFLFSSLFSHWFMLTLEVINDVNKIIAQIDINGVVEVSRIVSKILPRNYKTRKYYLYRDKWAVQMYKFPWYKFQRRCWKTHFQWGHFVKIIEIWRKKFVFVFGGKQFASKWYQKLCTLVWIFVRKFIFTRVELSWERGAKSPN